MKLLLKTERRSNHQNVDSSVIVLEGATIVIGRGEASAIRFSSESVALAHAALEQSGDGLVIHDLESVTGTQINEQRIRTATLQVGDRIKIGSQELTVFREGEVWGVAQILHEQEEADEDPQRAIQEALRRFDVTKQLPSLLSLSLFVLGSLTAIYLLSPLVSGKEKSWSSGPLAIAHRHLEDNCTSCHSEPFAPVKDKDCLACHSVKDHTPDFKKVAHHFSLGNKRCAECHRDHNGPEGILPHGARFCSDCHSNVKAIDPESKLLDIGSWDSHPDFRLTIHGADNAPVKVKRGTEGAIDHTPLKLNHAVHLKSGLRGPEGKVTLTCADCHSFSKDMQAPQPISFEKNCRSCHLLEFDERFPGEQVPHGDTRKVAEFLFSRYSQLFLGPDQKLRSPELSREKPGQTITPEQYNRATLELIRGEARKAETLLYSRTACQLCHQVEEHAEAPAGSERFTIKPPNVPVVWFPQARFNHRPHLNVACSSCHQGVDKSTDTKDVLLPDVMSCRECHSQKPMDNHIQSDCIECHRYHTESSLHVVGESPRN